MENKQLNFSSREQVDQILQGSKTMTRRRLKPQAGTLICRPGYEVGETVDIALNHTEVVASAVITDIFVEPLKAIS